MKCKFCKEELLENSSVCPACGKDNNKDELKTLKTVALVLVCVVMLVLLAGLVCYGVTGSFVPWQNGDGDATEGTEPVETKPSTVTILTADGEKVVEKEELDAYMDQVAVTWGDYELKNSELQLYYWLIAYNTEGIDGTKPLAEQVFDKETGKTAHEYCLEEALASWKEIMVMSDAANKAGFELAQAQKDELEGLKEDLEYYVEVYSYYYGYDLKSVDDLIQLMYGPGCTYEDYYNYCYHYYNGGFYWTELAESIEVSDDELESYFKEHEEALKKNELGITKDFGDLIDLRTIYVDVVMDKDTKEEDWDATLAAAQKIYDEYMAGDKTEESFGELAKEHSADEQSAANGGAYYDLYQGNLFLVDVRHILVMPEGGTKDENGNTTYSEEEWNTAKAEAEAILQQWLDGEMTEESFGKLANEHSDDNNGNVTNGGIYTDVYMGQMVEAFEQWCFEPERKTGDYGIVKTPYGYHVMYYVRADRVVDDWMCDQSRESGDVAMLKTDDGYQLVYFVDGEPAWIRYSRYGVQTEQAREQLEKLLEDVSIDIDEEKMVICQIG